MRTATAIALVLLVFAACKKEENPFEQLEHSSPNPPSEALPQDNFAWLHQRVFRPVCANSGCHDGTFEPEFRSVGSAYNSLVYAPVIANDPGNSFTYRVLPGDVPPVPHEAAAVGLARVGEAVVEVLAERLSLGREIVEGREGAVHDAGDYRSAALVYVAFRPSLRRTRSTAIFVG